MLTKSAALDIARESINMQVEALRYTGKGAHEIAKFEALALEVIAKGERLGGDFFAALQDDIYDGIRKRGARIASAIHAARED